MADIAACADVIIETDLVAVNSMLLHLSVPFNFMGYTCK